MASSNRNVPADGQKDHNRGSDPWNKGRQIGQKAALQPEEVRAVRAWLEGQGGLRNRVLFELAIDSKLRASDVVALRGADLLSPTGVVLSRATVRQKKTGRPVSFEVSARTRALVTRWIEVTGARGRDWLFPSTRTERHITTRQYARLLDKWLGGAGLDPSLYGTHSMRRTKVAHIYRETRNIRAVQLLLGHTSLAHTVRYLGFEIEDALSLSEQHDI